MLYLFIYLFIYIYLHLFIIIYYYLLLLFIYILFMYLFIYLFIFLLIRTLWYSLTYLDQTYNKLQGHGPANSVELYDGEGDRTWVGGSNMLYDRYITKGRLLHAKSGLAYLIIIRRGVNTNRGSCGKKVASRRTPQAALMKFFVYIHPD